MKKISFIAVIGLLSILYFSGNAVSQEKPFMVLEYMHVKPGNDHAYMEVENFWRTIHIAQQKKGNILDWSVWEVVAPYNMDAPYQYVVATVYAHFSDYLHPFKGTTRQQVFPNASEDSLQRMFSMTDTTRDLIRQDIFKVKSDINSGKGAKYAMAVYLKVSPEKNQAFQSFMKDHREKLAETVIKNNFASEWWYGGLMFPGGHKAAYNRIVCVLWDRDDMYDKEPPFSQYEKEDPAAFQGYKSAQTDHVILLHKVISLESPAK